MLEFFYGAGFSLLVTFPALGVCCWIIASQWKVIREQNNRIQAASFKEFAETLPKEMAVKAPKQNFVARSWIGTGKPPQGARTQEKKKPADPVLGTNY